MSLKSRLTIRQMTSTRFAKAYFGYSHYM